jgi:hypothetical protein
MNRTSPPVISGAALNARSQELSRAYHEPNNISQSLLLLLKATFAVWICIPKIIMVLRSSL